MRDGLKKAGKAGADNESKVVTPDEYTGTWLAI